MKDEHKVVMVKVRISVWEIKGSQSNDLYSHNVCICLWVGMFGAQKPTIPVEFDCFDGTEMLKV